MCVFTCSGILSEGASELRVYDEHYLPAFYFKAEEESQGDRYYEIAFV